jgi:hypothetical protein
MNDQEQPYSEEYTDGLRRLNEALWTWANETDQDCDPPDVWRDYTHLGQDGFSS